MNVPNEIVRLLAERRALKYEKECIKADQIDPITRKIKAIDESIDTLMIERDQKLMDFPEQPEDDAA